MGHYFTNDDVKSNIRKIETRINDTTFSFYSDNGVFSKDKIDYGSRLFLESIPLESIKGDVLDVGCGYGTIGIVVAKLTNASISMCDVNKRALHLAQMNAKENGVIVNVIESDCYSNISDDMKYDVILTNPPIRAGKKIVYDIVMNARFHLKSDGMMFIVIRKEQGAKSMINDLKEYYNVSIVEKNKGFFIICCKTC